MKRAIATLVALVFLCSAASAQSKSLQDLLSSAKPGQTVELPAGEFTGGVTLPAGVSLKGAGYGKTIILAKGCSTGIEVHGGEGASISDITVHGARGTNLLVQNARNVTIRRMRVTQGMIGLSVAGVTGGRVENVIADNNRYGMAISGGERNVVVNCTIADNASLGLSLPSGKDAVAFNNVITGSSLAVNVGQQAHGLALDHNLYGGLNIGRYRSQVARRTLNDWRYLTGLDAHSVSIPVRYEDPQKGRFAVTEPLDWSLDRTVTAAWGTSKLAGQAAPDEDIEGVRRPGSPGVGAFETAAKAPRPADGKFTVTTGTGLTSAGVFDAKGRLVAYLFQALPLPKGEHSFWLPARSQAARLIEAGDYELRLLEGRLEWEFLGTVGNTGTSDDPRASAPVTIDVVAIDSASRVITGRNVSEEHVNLRAYDGAGGKTLWLLHGNSMMHGLTVAPDNLLYAMRLEGAQMRVTRLDTTTGKVAPWGDKDYGSALLKDGATYTSLTALGEGLFYSDTSRNAICVGTTKSPDPTKTIEVAAPSSLAADAKANVVWAISGGQELVAVSPEGKVLARHRDLVPQPIELAARDGRLAVASRQTGKVHFFDVSDPAKLKPLGTLGRGDGPDGLFLPDRFRFQHGAMGVKLAMGPKGLLVVAEEEYRVQTFDIDGKLVGSSYPSRNAEPSKDAPHRTYGPITHLLDGENRSWWPESFHRALGGGRVAGHFQVDGRTFLVLNSLHRGRVEQAETDKRPPYYYSLTIVDYTPEKARPLTGMVWKWASKEPWTVRIDDNQDQIIDEKDKVVSTLTDADGKPVTGQLFDHRFTYVQPNGDITVAGLGGWFVRWPMAGLDKQGVPIYRPADRVVLTTEKDAIISPYNLAAVGPGCADHLQGASGGWLCLYRAPGAPWPVMINNGGSDVVGIDKDGQVKWLHPFGQINLIGSLTGADGLYIAALADTFDCFVLNEDGLALNGLSPTEKANFVGHWVDDPTMVGTFVDAQGKVNVFMGDYVSKPGAHWYRLQKREVRTDKVPVKVSAETAAQLAALPAKPFDVAAGKPAKAIVRIPQLKESLKIDGDLQKWRDLGIAPQVIITPDTSAGIEGGASDCSAIVRLAYHGQDLYLQVLRFDDIITTHQPRSRAYQQDTVEMSINGNWEGIKFNLSMTSDVGPVNQVDGRQLKAHTLEHDHSPLVIKVLDDAEEVTERQVIENIYGVDLRTSKVQVFETRVPMDEKTYAGRPDARFEFKSGVEFYLGFLIDDNDQPGTDLQNYLWWPVTYGNFNPKESGAQAVLE